MKIKTLFEYLEWIGISLLVAASYMFLGGFHVIGPISLRLLVSYGLLGYTWWRGSTKYRPTKGMKMYFYYLAFFVFISILNSNAYGLKFAKNLIATHFVCCTAIFAFPRFFKTEASIRGAYIVLAMGFLLNAFVTYLQFQNSALGWAIGMYINPTNIGEVEEMQMGLAQAEVFEKSFLMGIMGGSVANGYFVAMMLPVMTCFIWDKIGIKTIWTIFMFVIAGICIYMIQQRMALVVATLYVISILALKVKRPSFMSFAIIAILVFTLLYSIYQSMDISDVGRLGAVKEDETRMNTLYVLDNFLSNPRQILLGYISVKADVDEFVFHTMGHNTFLDALRRGGIFLMFVFIVLYICLCKSLIKIVHFSRRVKDFRSLGMALGCISYLIYSLTHSTGVQSGSIMFWTLFMLTIQSHRVTCETLEAKKTYNNINKFDRSAKK